MADLHVWLADKDGYFSGQYDATGPGIDDLETFTANAAKNGQTVIAKGDDPSKTRPPDRPDPLAPKRDQLAALRAKGWANLTPDEQTTARALAFDLGQYAPS